MPALKTKRQTFFSQYQGYQEALTLNAGFPSICCLKLKSAFNHKNAKNLIKFKFPSITVVHQIDDKSATAKIKKGVGCLVILQWQCIGEDE